MKMQSLTGKWEFRKKGDREWLPASVPGGVHPDLIALGRIPDPFIDDNEKRVQWVVENDWEYRRYFIVDDELLKQPNIWLICDGLDTLATVSINGVVLGKACNMFRQYRWDVKSLLISGWNEIQIIFDSPVRFVTACQKSRPLAGVPQAIPGGPYLRKAPCHFGWDWGPQLPPIGIWKDICLEGYEGARIDDVHLRQFHTEEKVSIEAQIRIQIWEEASYQARIRVIAPDGQTFESKASIDDKTCTLRLDILDPQLWYPNGYGAQPLYQVQISLHQALHSLDQRDYQLGLRTIELRQQSDEWGRSFAFIVNGLPVFVKGSNWIPADSFPTRSSNNDLERLIRSAAETHQNMLRVWGGGFYENERFYDLCDHFGILVWQDFIFACSVYPLDEEDFVANVHKEVVENVRRLRHRACLALWCGNNEMEWGWVDWDWKAPEYHDLKAAYDRFFHHILPTWCESEDPDHAYWASSPYSGTPFEDPNGQQQGDAHYWDVWHGRKPFTAYRSQFPRFMSEFGFQSLPPMPTICSFADESEWNISSYIMDQHQKNESGNALIVSQMLESFRFPKDFESLVYLSLVLQAEGIRYGVEHWRRYPKRTSGILYWQLNDCWPAASWSSLDYFGRWKALHYAARRFYAPLLLSIEDKNNEMNIMVTNDLPDLWKGSIRWSLETLTGEKLQVGEKSVAAAPFDATLAAALNFSNDLDDDLKRKTIFIAELCQDQQVLARQTAFFVPIKYLHLADPVIQSRIHIEQRHICINLHSLSFACLVELNLKEADVVFSDNYFNMPMNRNVKITAPLPEGWDLEQVNKAFGIRSIYDSYSHEKKKKY